MTKQSLEKNYLEKFFKVCNKVLDKHASLKSKFVSGIMNRKLSKAIMKRARLWNNFVKGKTVKTGRIAINKEVTVLRS